MDISGRELITNHAIAFIETPIFTRQIKQIATDDKFKELQRELIESPEKSAYGDKRSGQKR